MKLLIIPLLLFAIVSCSKEKPFAFNTNDNYIYFDMPFKLDSYYNPTTERMDHLEYSFAFDDNDIQSHTFEIPIAVMGVSQDRTRTYTVVVSDETTASSIHWNEAQTKESVLKKGEVFTNLNITVNRTPDLTKELRCIVLQLLPNEEFALGDYMLQKVKISFSDILLEPAWWPKYVKYFGPYRKEVYRKWRDIYPLGADTYVNSVNGITLYWDNMPGTFIPSMHIILGMHIQVLKQYFIDHVVYPDGDPTKPRITLPI